MLSEKLKLEVGPIWNILSYLFKQLEMGLVCIIKMLQTMLSEKLVWGGIPIDYSLFLVQTVWNGTCCHLKMLKTMLSENLKLDVGPLLTIFPYLLKQLEIQLEMRLDCNFKMVKTMLLEKLKLEVGPILTIFSYLFKQLEMGLVCQYIMLKTMPSEKLKLGFGNL